MGAGAGPVVGFPGLEADGLRHRPLDLGFERNRAGLARHDVHREDLPASIEEDPASVGMPRDGEIGSVAGPRRLAVPVEAAEKIPLLPGAEIPHDQAGVVDVPVHEGQQLPVRRQGRSEGAADPIHHHRHLARREVEPFDRGTAGGDDIGIEGEGVDGPLGPLDQEAGAVRLRGRGVHDPAARHQHLAAAGQFEGHHRARDAVVTGARVDPPAIGRPHRLVDVPGRRRHVPEAGALAVHDPDVVASGAVGGKRDRPAVRTVAGEEIPRPAAGQAAGGAAFDRHLIDVAQQVEGDGPAVGRDRQAGPGTLGGFEGEGSGGAGWGFDVPAGGFLGPGRLDDDGNG